MEKTTTKKPTVKKVLWVICDKNQKYVDTFASYVERHEENVMTGRFTEKEALYEFARKKKIDTLILGEEMAEEVQADEQGLPAAARTVILAAEEEDLTLDLPKVGRYQRASDIIFKIKTAGKANLFHTFNWSSFDEEQDLATPQDNPVTAVWSPIGRCGKTAFAVCLAMALAKRKHTLYVNLEDFHGFAQMLPEDVMEYDLSDVLFLLYKGERDTMPLNVRSATARTVKNWGELDYMPPMFSCCDVRADDNSYMRWIEILMAAHQYEEFVLDLGDKTGDVCMLERCGKIYVPMLPDKVSQAKIAQLKHNLKARNLEDILGKMVFLTLPHIPERDYENFPMKLPEGRMGQFVADLMTQGDTGDNRR